MVYNYFRCPIQKNQTTQSDSKLFKPCFTIDHASPYLDRSIVVSGSRKRWDR